jgi:hypothetical protein
MFRPVVLTNIRTPASQLQQGWLHMTLCSEFFTFDSRAFKMAGGDI